MRTNLISLQRCQSKLPMSVMVFVGVVILNLGEGFSLDSLVIPFLPVLSIGLAAYFYLHSGAFSILLLLSAYVTSFALAKLLCVVLVGASWSTVALLSVAYTVQVWLFGEVIRRFSCQLPIGLPNKKAFFLIVSIAVVSAFVPVVNVFFWHFFNFPASSIYFFIEDSSALFVNVFYDWASIFLGAVFAFELICILLSDSKILRDRALQFLSILFIGFIGFLIVLLARRWECKEEEVKYQIQSQRIADAIQSRLDEQVAILNVMRNAIFTVSMTEESFRLLTYDFVKKFKTIQAVEWAPRVESQVRDRFLAIARVEYPGFNIKSKSDDDFHFVMPEVRREYFPITYIQPYNENILVQGFDLLSSDVRRDGVRRALSTDGAVSTAPIRLIQDESRGFGILLMEHAISKDGSDGVVLLAIKVADFFKEYTPREVENISIKMTDLQTGLVVVDGKVGTEIWRGVIKVGDRVFEVRTGLTVPLDMLPYSWKSISAVLLTVFGSVMFFLFSYVLRDHVFSTENLVKIRTEDLEKSKNWIDRITRSIGEGVVVFDGLAGVVFSNEKAESMLGFDSGGLIGKGFSDIFSLLYESAIPVGVSLFDAVNSKGKGELLAVRNDGSVFAVEYTSSRMVDSDEKKSFVFVFYDVTDRKKYESMLADYAFHDQLTGLYNRRYFMARLDEALAHSAVKSVPLALLFIDMDGFKGINDTFGHDVGDRALVEFSDRVKSSIRSSDVSCRLGGDEFAVLIENCQNPFQTARVISNNIQLSLKIPMDVEGQFVVLKASIGIAIYHPEIDRQHTSDYIISRADAAMYDAKRSNFSKIAYA